MKLRHLFLLTGLLIHTHSFSQVYVFVVCGNRGVNSIKSHGEWKLLKTQSTIDQFDQIKTSGENCYLGLLHTSGRSVVIRKPGTYNAEDLLKKVNSGNNAIASKYADFVYSKLTTVSNENVSDKTRAADEKTIKVYLPQSGKIFGTEETIQWSALPGNNSYRVVIKNIFDEVVAEYTSDKPWIRIDFSNPRLRELNVVFLSVELQNNPLVHSEGHGITRLADEKLKNVSDSLNLIRMDIGEESPLNNLIIASFFEDKQLLMDAGTCYSNVIENSPGVTDFEKIYSEFLNRNGLK